MQARKSATIYIPQSLKGALDQYENHPFGMRPIEVIKQVIKQDLEPNPIPERALDLSALIEVTSRSVIFSPTLPITDYHQLELKAYKLGLSVSSYVCVLVATYLTNSAVIDYALPSQTADWPPVNVISQIAKKRVELPRYPITQMALDEFAALGFTGQLETFVISEAVQSYVAYWLRFEGVLNVDYCNMVIGARNPVKTIKPVLGEEIENIIVNLAKRQMLSKGMMLTKILTFYFRLSKALRDNDLKSGTDLAKSFNKASNLNYSQKVSLLTH